MGFFFLSASDVTPHVFSMEIPHCGFLFSVCDSDVTPRGFSMEISHLR